MIAALPVRFEDVKDDHDYQGEEVVDEGESLGSASDDIEAEQDKQREVCSFEFLSFFDDFDASWIIFLNLLCLHLDSILVESHHARLLFLILLRLLGLALLSLFVLISIGFLLNRIDSFLDERNDIGDAEDDEDEEGHEDSPSLAVLSL